MTPKEQAIKKAYGEYYDAYRKYIDPDGWVSWVRGAPLHNMEETDIHESGLYWRPKSIRGIENNRGWISVKDRLPKGADHGKDFWLYDKDQDFYPATWDNYSRAWETEKSFISPHEVTHWQPVVKPEPPLY